MSENLIIEVLGEIISKVCDVDIPSPTVPEYVEHHEACKEIMIFIDEKMDMFRGKSDREIANMLLKR